MSRYLLDTKIISNATKPAPPKALTAWMSGQADEDLVAAFGSCGDGHSLDSDELQFLIRRAFDLQAKRYSLADAFGDLVERAPLRVAAGDLGN